MSSRKLSCHLLVIAVLLMEKSLIQGKEVHIKLTSCNEHDDTPCYEWSEFLNKRTTLFTKLYFAPGKYILHKNLKLVSTLNFSIVGESHGNTHPVEIRCLKARSLIVQNKSSLEIRNIKFVVCNLLITGFNRLSARLSSLHKINLVFCTASLHGMLTVGFKSDFLQMRKRIITIESDSKHGNMLKCLTSIIFLSHMKNENGNFATISMVLDLDHLQPKQQCHNAVWCLEIETDNHHCLSNNYWYRTTRSNCSFYKHNTSKNISDNLNGSILCYFPVENATSMICLQSDDETVFTQLQGVLLKIPINKDVTQNLFSVAIHSFNISLIAINTPYFQVFHTIKKCFSNFPTLRHNGWSCYRKIGITRDALQKIYIIKLKAKCGKTKVDNIAKQNRKLRDITTELCVCHSQGCSTSPNIGTAYPGQRIQLKLQATSYIVALYVDGMYNDDVFHVCDSVSHSTLKSRSKPQVNLVYTNCTTLSYTIRSNSSKWCMLHLRMATSEATLYSYNVTLKRCPLGLILHDGLCICDPILLGVIDGLTCDVQTGEFERPKFSWIALGLKNRSEIIYTTACHYDYCLLTSIKVNLSGDPSVQCLPGRSGIACGKCKQGLSTVFGSSACKKCSNSGLYLILVFAVVGLLLILMLFVLNITVTDGKLYGFILYINCVNMHSIRIFPKHDITYTIVSLFNLDLGIEVCFYDGMTKYTATWMRFVFPAYLLLIVLGLAFASRYFTTIENVTRRRVIPVIATLYLLTFNKLMVITAQVLFSFSFVYHFHSSRSEIYWSKDTDISLFGVRYSLLFGFCIVIFVFVLMPINILLLFPGYCYRIRFVTNNVRPFIDAYQAPLKDNCRYFIGVEFLVRTSIYGLTTISAKQIGAFYLVIILMYLVFTGWVQPFRSYINYLIYSTYVLYIGFLATLFLYYTPDKPVVYEVIFNIIIYLSLLEFLGILIFFAVRNVLHYNDAYKRKFTNSWNSLKQIYPRIFNKPVKIQDQMQLEESCIQLREELLACDPTI